MNHPVGEKTAELNHLSFIDRSSKTATQTLFLRITSSSTEDLKPYKSSNNGSNCIVYIFFHIVLWMVSLVGRINTNFHQLYFQQQQTDVNSLYADPPPQNT